MQQLENPTLIKNKYKRNLKIKKVKYNLEIFRCLFYLVGDGSFQKGIYLSNINYRLHKDFIRVFEKYFDIKRNEWILSQTYNEKFKKTRIEKSNQFWEKELSLKIKRRYKTKFNTNKLGATKVIYDSIELSRFLHKLLEEITKRIENNQLTKKELCSILDGILNAEGSASINQEKEGIHKTTISFNPYCQKEKELFSKVLEKLNLLRYSRIEQEKRFIFSKWINNYKFVRKFVKNNITPFSLYPKRAERLCGGFLNHQRTKSIRKYLGIIEKKDKQTLNEITKKLNYDKTSVEEAILRKFKPFEFWRLTGKGINKNPYKVSITKEGKLFLRTIKKLRKWHNWSLRNIQKDKMKEKFPFEKEKQEIVERQEVKTNSKYGCYPEKRSTKDILDYGIININKQQGPTSHQITDYVKKILGVKKAGHSGTLEL